MSIKFSLSCISLNSFLKLKEMRFLSKMLNASAITIEGTKITFSPFFHISQKSLRPLDLFLGLLVNHQRRACVSVTKFIKALYPYFAIEGLFCESYIFLGNIHPFENPLERYNFLPVGVSFLRTVNFKSTISFSMVSILWSMSIVPFKAACFIRSAPFLKIFY